MFTIKTMQEWNSRKCRFLEYVQPGDYVDEEIVNYFLGVVPPLHYSVDNILQVGEAADVDDYGRLTYTTFYFVRQNTRNEKINQWQYVGCKPEFGSPIIIPAGTTNKRRW